jgi:hypothetical protein
MEEIKRFFFEPASVQVVFSSVGNFFNPSVLDGLIECMEVVKPYRTSALRANVYEVLKDITVIHKYTVPLIVIFSDHELAITTEATFAEGSKNIANIDEVLSELHKNSSSHGTGATFRAVSEIDFDLAFEHVIELQNQEFIPYDPFVYGGTNCSRFVSETILAGQPSLPNA